jgi:hypothetical protein
MAAPVPFPASNTGPGPNGSLPYAGGNSPVRQGCVVEPWHWGLAAIWTADGYICPDGALTNGRPQIVYEAPCTGFVYGRDGCCGWVPVLTRWQADCLYAPVTTVPFPEAPADGNLYLRNGASQSWVQNGAAPSVVQEAPLDGNYYVRWMGQWVQIDQVPDLVTFPISGGTY